MTAMEEDIDDRFAGIDIDSLLNRVERRPRSYGRKQCLYESPEFTRRLSGEETVLEGQSLCLDCKVDGFPAPSLRWFKDDEEIVDHPRIRVEGDGKGRYSLYIDHVNKGDEAAYRCRAENVEGSSSCYFFLSVKCKPKHRKKRDKNSAKKRSVSFPPMFSTIVEKVEEEDKLGKEQDILPPSPLTQFYYALTLKGRQTWPSFLGDWAYRHVLIDDDDNNDADDVGPLQNGHAPNDVPEGLSGRALMRRNQRRRELNARSAAKRRRMQEEEEEEQARRSEQQESEKGGRRSSSLEEHLESEEEAIERKRTEEKEKERRKREEALRQRRLRREQKAQEEHEAKVRQMEEERKETERLKRVEEEKERERKREEEERIKKEQLRREEERRKEEQKREEEKKKEEQKQREEEKRKEEQRWKEEDDEERRKEEEKRKDEEMRREEERKKEEQRRREEEKRKEEIKKIEEEKKRTEEKRMEEEKRKEQKRKEEERTRLAILKEEQRQRDEERKNAERAEAENKIEEDTKRKEIEKKKREEEKSKAEREKIKRQEEMQRRAEKGKCVSRKEDKSDSSTTDSSKPKSGKQKNVLQKFAKFLDENEVQIQGKPTTSKAPAAKSGSMGMIAAANKLKSKMSITGEDKERDKQLTAVSSSDNLPNLSEISTGPKETVQESKREKIDRNIPHDNASSQKAFVRDEDDDAFRAGDAKRETFSHKNKGELESKNGETEKNGQMEREPKKTTELEQADTEKAIEKEFHAKKKEEEKRKEVEVKREEQALEEERLRREEELKEKIKARQREQEEIQLKQQKQTEQKELRRKQQQQKEELKRKMEEEEQRVKEKLEREQKEERLRHFMKEKIRQEQLQRQYEEETRRKKEREQESRKRREEDEKKREEMKEQETEERRLEIARRAELEKDLFEVKIYKRDYSFSDLRKSLESYGGGGLLNPEEHKYWDEILEKHNYSISDLKSAFDLSSTTFASQSKDRKSRARVRRNSIDGDAALDRMKRSGSLSDIRDAYTKSLDRPKKDQSGRKKKQKNDEFLKRSSSISDLKQLFATSGSLSSLDPPEMIVTSGSDEVSSTSKNTETSSHIITDTSSSQATANRKQAPKSSVSSHPELTKLSVNVAAKRASFHELVNQVQQRNAEDISKLKERAKNRASVHTFDSYGSREIPVYKRVSSWRDEFESSKRQDGASAMPISPPSSQSSSRPMSPNEEEGSTTSSRVRPFVYNSIRTIARNDADKDKDAETVQDDEDDHVFENDNNAKRPKLSVGEESDGKDSKTSQNDKRTHKVNESDDETPKTKAKRAKNETQVNVDKVSQDKFNNTVETTRDSGTSSPTNRICLHAPLDSNEDQSKKETSNGIASPGIFLESTDADDSGSIPSDFERGEREPTPFFKPLKGISGNESLNAHELSPSTPPFNVNFEREPTPYFDEKNSPQLPIWDGNSSSESTPDREMEALDRAKSHFLTVPGKSAFTFEGPVRAPRDSTPTPFKDTDPPSDPLQDSLVGLRPPRESTPFFMKENKDWKTDTKTENSKDSPAGSTPGQDNRNTENSDLANSKRGVLKPSPNRIDNSQQVNNRNSLKNNNVNGVKSQTAASTDAEKQSKSENRENKSKEGMKAVSHPGEKEEIPKQKPERTKANLTPSNNRPIVSKVGQTNTLSESKDGKSYSDKREVSNAPQCIQQNKESSRSVKPTPHVLTHRDTNVGTNSPVTKDKQKLPDSKTLPTNQSVKDASSASTVAGAAAPSNVTTQSSPGSLTTQSSPGDVTIQDSDSSQMTAAGRKAAAAAARRELYRQRKLKEAAAKIIETKRTDEPLKTSTELKTPVQNQTSSESHHDKNLITSGPTGTADRIPAKMKQVQESSSLASTVASLIKQRTPTAASKHPTSTNIIETKRTDEPLKMPAEIKTPAQKQTPPESRHEKKMIISGQTATTARSPAKTKQVQEIPTPAPTTSSVIKQRAPTSILENPTTTRDTETKRIGGPLKTSTEVKTPAQLKTPFETRHGKSSTTSSPASIAERFLARTKQVQEPSNPVSANASVIKQKTPASKFTHPTSIKKIETKRIDEPLKTFPELKTPSQRQTPSGTRHGQSLITPKPTGSVKTKRVQQISSPVSTVSSLITQRIPTSTLAHPTSITTTGQFQKAPPFTLAEASGNFSKCVSSTIASTNSKMSHTESKRGTTQSDAQRVLELAGSTKSITAPFLTTSKTNTTVTTIRRSLSPSSSTAGPLIKTKVTTSISSLRTVRQESRSPSPNTARLSSSNSAWISSNSQSPNSAFNTIGRTEVAPASKAPITSTISATGATTLFDRSKQKFGQSGDDRNVKSKASFSQRASVTTTVTTTDLPKISSSQKFGALGRYMQKATPVTSSLPLKQTSTPPTAATSNSSLRRRINDASVYNNTGPAPFKNKGDQTSLSQGATHPMSTNGGSVPRSTSTTASKTKRLTDPIYTFSLYSSTLYSTSIYPEPRPAFTDIRKSMPISHRLTDTIEDYKAANIMNIEEHGMPNMSLWSKLAKAFVNTFTNNIHRSKEGRRKSPKRRKSEKSGDSRNVKIKSKKKHIRVESEDLTKLSPFGRFTLEGVFLTCVMTFIALSADVRVEVFICYVLAAYYTFFVLCVLRILE